MERLSLPRRREISRGVGGQPLHPIYAPVAPRRALDRPAPEELTFQPWHDWFSIPILAEASLLPRLVGPDFCPLCSERPRFRRRPSCGLRLSKCQLCQPCQRTVSREGRGTGEQIVQAFRLTASPRTADNSRIWPAAARRHLYSVDWGRFSLGPASSPPRSSRRGWHAPRA